MKWILMAFIVRGLAGCDLSPEDQARQRSQVAIGLCWAEQAKKSLDPATARFVAGACEKMESDYRSKYNRNP